ncbi:hypothetical protein [Candidatus Clostridium radicumherbarum]|uniref:Uncharacterized protein n=1 Tax=Candidatus Clostridium radicumherbarum TaxID=3381662 RepID=A0ABW8TXH3_9CLOT
MLWNAPIWINETLVSIVKFTIGVVVYHNRFTPLHFIIRKEYQYRYTGVNINFLYEIQGDKQQLAKKGF